MTTTKRVTEKKTTNRAIKELANEVLASVRVMEADLVGALKGGDWGGEEPSDDLIIGTMLALKVQLRLQKAAIRAALAIHRQARRSAE